MYLLNNILKLKFNRSQDEWECDLNLTYPPFKLNGLRTTGPRSETKGCLHESGLKLNPDRTHPVSAQTTGSDHRGLNYICLHESGLSCNSFRIEFISFFMPD